MILEPKPVTIIKIYRSLVYVLRLRNLIDKPVWLMLQIDHNNKIYRAVIVFLIGFLFYYVLYITFNHTFYICYKPLMKSISPNGKYIVSFSNCNSDEDGYYVFRESTDIFQYRHPISKNYFSHRGDHVTPTEFTWSEDSGIVALWDEDYPIFGYNFNTCQEISAEYETYMLPTPKSYKNLTESEWFKTLLEKGNGEKYLAYAVFHDKEEIVNLLLDFGVDININSYRNRSPLYLATQNNNVKIMRKLLSNGANPDIRSPDNETTALHIAAYKNLYEAMDLLLQFDADPSVRDITDKRPIDYAVEMNAKECSELLNTQ